MLFLKKIAICSFLALFLMPPMQALSQEARSGKRQAVQPITLTVPAPALHQMLAGLLPLPLEQPSKSTQFQGTITIDSISSLSMDTGQVQISGQISGRNMAISTNVGGQNIHVRLGNMSLPIVCDVGLRFDRRQQQVLLTPRFQRSTQSLGEADEALVSLLNTLSQEYAVPLHDLLPFSGELGGKPVQIRMEVLDLRAENNLLTLRLRPRTRP
jgi:hypothetical protein